MTAWHKAIHRYSILREALTKIFLVTVPQLGRSRGFVQLDFFESQAAEFGFHSLKRAVKNYFSLSERFLDFQKSFKTAAFQGRRKDLQIY
jgi:hypothetical protein